MKAQTEWLVLVIERQTETIVESLRVGGFRAAERIERAKRMNMDPNEFYTRLRRAPNDEPL